MWRTGLRIMGIVALSLACGGIVSVSAKQAAKPAAAQTQAAPKKPPKDTQAGQAKDERIVFTFAGDEQMRAFTELWRERQGILVRINVLQAYWSEEQLSLTRLNNKLAADYKLDTTKNYTLDTERRLLIEQESHGPAAQAPAALSASAGSAQSDLSATAP